MLNDSLYSSDKSDWATPQYLFDILNKEFKFQTDVCASKHNAKCESYYDIETDGLSQDWVGNCWMNPPYGRGIDKWVQKAFEESRSFCICVCLLPVRSDTKWWHNYVMRSSEIRLCTRRLSFEGSNNKAPFPAAIVVFRPKLNRPILSYIEV